VFWNANAAGIAATRQTARKVLYGYVGSLLLGVPLHDGLVHSWNRAVQQFGAGTTFDQPVNVTGMAGLKWGEPTIMNPFSRQRLERSDFEELNGWLSRTGRNFFVFPDATILYGLHRRVSPQPWLYFSPGHSFLVSEFPHVDATVIDSLQRNHVEIIVLEKASWLGNEKLLAAMPRLHRWIEADFQKFRTFGIFEVWTMRRLDPMARESTEVRK
jgi:hypothetical protein